MGKKKWPVLHDKSTVTSFHHSVYASSFNLPNDSLDIHLLSCYRHNLEIFADDSDVVRNPSRLEHACQHEKASSKAENDCHPHTIIHGGVQARPSIHSVKLGIGSNHIAQTIAGFSRKADGTFYNL